MNKYAEGPVTCRWWFTHRELTGTEQIDFDRGLGLPEDAAVDPWETILVYEAPDAEPVVVTGASIYREARGIYHGIAPGDVAGVWTWRALALDEHGSTMRATFDQFFEIEPTVLAIP